MMIINYCKVFIQLFFRHTALTFIKVFGLAIGFTCCLIIALFVHHEFSFDRFFTNANELYRVSTTASASGSVPTLNAVTFFGIAPLLKENFPAITEIARLQSKPSLININGDLFYENEFKLVDPTFFKVFDFIWLEGDPAFALSGATDVVLTTSFAKKYFGSESPLGQSLLLSEGVALRVTGVIEDLPSNTHLSGSIFAAMGLKDVLEPEETQTRQWAGISYYTYAVLRPDADIEQLQLQLETFSKVNIPLPSHLSFILYLDAVTDIHLNRAGGDLKPTGSKLNIAVLSAIGIGILLVACANFVNLSTARSAHRFGEVGLRLTLGARRLQLIAQFLGESILFVLLAMVLALVMSELLLPGIQAFLELDFAVDSLLDPTSLAILLGLGLLLGLAAGWYPALLMSRFKPAQALKRQQVSLIKGVALKNVLVVLQFAIAITMIVASIVIWSQLRFANALELGYARDQIVVVTTNELGSLERIRLLKERLLQGGDIEAAALSRTTAEQQVGSFFLGTTERDGTQHYLNQFAIDSDYLSLYQIPLMAGRLLREDMPTDLFRAMDGGSEFQFEGSFVLSVSGARSFGWSPEEAIGKHITDRVGSSFTVVGVVADTIHTAYELASPALYVIPQGDVLGDRSYLSLKLGDNPANALASIDRIWSEINPQEPIIRSFINDSIDLRYRSESRLMQLSFIFSAIAILISCMGLFGLASFNVECRTKEIGIRKVMGSSVWNTVLLLTNDFSKLVLISNVLAWPVAYFAMNRWLENFAYRIDLTLFVFVGSGLIALSIAWVTVGGTAAKAASQKPILALRYE